MTAPRRRLGTLADPTKGLIAVPAITICTYGLLCHLLYLQVMCAMRADFICEFWSYPRLAGMSLLDLFTFVNILFAVYILVYAWSALSDRRRRSRRTILFWGTLALLIALLAGLQVYQTKVGALFGLPDEILSLRAEEFHEYHARGMVEDLVLPKSDMCEGFKKPFEKRCTINITRPGHFVRNRRDLGHVNDAYDRIRSLLIEETSKHEREADGASRLILLIRGDSEVHFGPILEVMQLCREEETGIYRIELACRCDLESRIPEAAERLNRYYRLPEGKLDAYLPRTDGGRDPIHVTMIDDEELGFRCTVDETLIEGSDPVRRFFETMEALQAKGGDRAVVIRVGGSIELAHVIAVLAECRRTGAAAISLEPL